MGLTLRLGVAPRRGQLPVRRRGGRKRGRAVARLLTVGSAGARAIGMPFLGPGLALVAPAPLLHRLIAVGSQLYGRCPHERLLLARWWAGSLLITDRLGRSCRLVLVLGAVHKWPVSTTQLVCFAFLLVVLHQPAATCAQVLRRDEHVTHSLRRNKRHFWGRRPGAVVTTGGVGNVETHLANRSSFRNESALIMRSADCTKGSFRFQPSCTCPTVYCEWGEPKCHQLVPTHLISTPVYTHAQSIVYEHTRNEKNVRPKGLTFYTRPGTTGAVHTADIRRNYCGQPALQT